MNAVKDHVFAARLTVEQLSKGTVWLYLLPSVVVALLFYAVFSFFGSISERAEVASDLPLIGEYITMGVQKTVGFFVWITNQFYMFFILTLLSPVNCLLSERIDNEVTGARFNGGIVRILTDLFRALLIMIFSLMVNFLVMGCWALFAWITGFHVLDPIIYFLIGSFFIGFSFYDFSLERYGVGFFGTVGFGFEKMAYMAITGSLFTLIYMIPVVGILLSPFLLTILSTIVFVKMNNKIPYKQIPNGTQQ